MSSILEVEEEQKTIASTLLQKLRTMLGYSEAESIGPALNESDMSELDQNFHKIKLELLNQQEWGKLAEEIVGQLSKNQSSLRNFMSQSSISQTEQTITETCFEQLQDDALKVSQENSLCGSVQQRSTIDQEEFLDIDLEQAHSLTFEDDKTPLEILKTIVVDFIYLCKEGMEAIHRRTRYTDIQKTLKEEELAFQKDERMYLDESTSENRDRQKLVDYILEQIETNLKEELEQLGQKLKRKKGEIKRKIISAQNECVTMKAEYFERQSKSCLA